MLHFQFATLIRAPREAVLAFHGRPDAICLLTPPWQPIQLLRRHNSLKAGSEVVLRVWMGPLPIIWLARHTEFRGLDGFVDEQIRGPFRYWRHEHRFQQNAEGTLLVDDIACTLPGAPVTHLLLGWLVRLQLRSMFAYRHAVTRRNCEAPGGMAV
ncbi:MAG: SRPBCC family protein [Bryobacterales bacterium]|nr:SRPBCC family protein [Bryobacterales bacterium]